MTGRPASYCKPGDDDPSLATTNLCIYSHPGEGKTVLWGTGGERVCFMVSDPEGIISARAQGHRPHSIQVTDYEELQEAYEWFEGSAEPKKNGIRWIVWDSISLFQDRALHDDIMTDAHDENPKQDLDVPSRREYLQSMNRIGRYVRQFALLPFDFGISAHVLDGPAPEGDGNIFMPAIQGKGMPGKVSGYMNVVGYLSKGPSLADEKKIIQKLQVRRVGRVYAKDRFNVLGNEKGFMERPSLPKIDTLIDGWRANIKKQTNTKAPAAQKAS